MITNREELENIKELPNESKASNHTQVRLLIIIADELLKANHYFESERIHSIKKDLAII